MSDTTPTEQHPALAADGAPPDGVGSATPDAAPTEPAQAPAAEPTADEAQQVLQAQVLDDDGAPVPALADDGEAAKAESKGPPNLSPAACAALLAQHFPALFGAGRALPIKLRVQGDIQQRVPGVFNKKSLSIFLHRYTTSTAYLKALSSAPQRLDLDGAPAGEIDAVHREAAAAEVQRRKQMFEERRAAEREQQRLAAQEARRAQQTQNTARHAARDRARDNAEAEARRNRAALLRAFETTTLTPANFCALKGLVEAELHAQLAQARQEREQRAQEPRFEPRNDGPQGHRPPSQQPPRGPRPDRPPRRGPDRGG